MSEKMVGGAAVVALLLALAGFIVPGDGDTLSSATPALAQAQAAQARGDYQQVEKIGREYISSIPQVLRQGATAPVVEAMEDLLNHNIRISDCSRGIGKGCSLRNL